MIEIVFVALIFANIFFTLSHLVATERDYGDNGRAFLVSSFGVLVAIVSAAAVMAVGAPGFISAIVVVSATISLLFFALSLGAAGGADG